MRYTIEYIDNERDLERLNSGQHPAPWELFKKEVIEEKISHEVYTGAESPSGEAWVRFILWSLCPEQIWISNANNVTHPLFCQMWMEGLDDEGNVVYEDFCELPGTTKNVLFSAINRQLNTERNAARENIEAVAAELKLYKQFIKKCHAEKAFDEFRREAL